MLSAGTVAVSGFGCDGLWLFFVVPVDYSLWLILFVDLGFCLRLQIVGLMLLVSCVCQVNLMSLALLVCPAVKPCPCAASNFSVAFQLFWTLKTWH